MYLKYNYKYSFCISSSTVNTFTSPAMNETKANFKFAAENSYSLYAEINEWIGIFLISTINSLWDSICLYFTSYNYIFEKGISITNTHL